MTHACMPCHLHTCRSQDDRVYVDVRNSTLVQPLVGLILNSYYTGGTKYLCM